MRKQLLLLVALALLCALGGVGTAGIVTENITCQGRLTDASGTPLSGTYTMTFRLYEVSAGGTPLVTDIQDVPVTSGAFTKSLAFATQYFDGRGLWLGIKVGADPEMTPRLEIQPVPYALSLRPGSGITSTDTTPALNLMNKGGGRALNVTTTGSNSYGINIITNGTFSNGVNSTTKGSNSKGIYAETAGDNSDGIYAYTTGTNSPGIDVISKGNTSDGVNIVTSGLSSRGVNISTTGKGGYGVKIKTVGDTSSGITSEVWGNRSSGISSFSFRDYGVEGFSDYGGGVRGFSTQNAGIVGTGKEGGNFTTHSGGDSMGSLQAAIHAYTIYGYNPGALVHTDGDLSEGVNVTTNGMQSAGVTASTSGDNSHGVDTFTTGDLSNGVNVTTTGSNSYGVRVKTYGPGSNAILGETYGDTAAVAGVAHNNTGLYGYGVFATSQNRPAIWAQSYGGSYGLQTPNSIKASSYETGSSDVAEYMPVAENVTPGTVVIIGEDGTLTPSTTSYDTKVAGIVSTAPGVTLGDKENGNPGEQVIAVAGRVPCKVDASYGPINPGDVLTTSPTPGYAMKAEPVDIGGVEIYQPSTILGKAMGTLESGTGTIEVLVTLQ